MISQQVRTDCRIYMDASGSWGCGGFFCDKWFQYAWTAEWSEIGIIMMKEFLPIVISCTVWGPTQKSIEVQWDNTEAVSATNKGFSKDKIAIRLLHCLWFFVALFQIRIIATHIPDTDMWQQICFPEIYYHIHKHHSFHYMSLHPLLSPRQLD